MSEAGLPGYSTELWYGLFAPSGTPQEVVGKLNAAVNTLLETPEMRDKIAKQGGEAVGGPPQELGALVRSEIAKWAKITKEFGIPKR